MRGLVAFAKMWILSQVAFLVPANFSQVLCWDLESAIQIFQGSKPTVPKGSCKYLSRAALLSSGLSVTLVALCVPSLTAEEMMQSPRTSKRICQYHFIHHVGWKQLLVGSSFYNPCRPSKMLLLHVYAVVLRFF